MSHPPPPAHTLTTIAECERILRDYHCSAPRTIPLNAHDYYYHIYCENVRQQLNNVHRKSFMDVVRLKEP